MQQKKEELKFYRNHDYFKMIEYTLQCQVCKEIKQQTIITQCEQCNWNFCIDCIIQFFQSRDVNTTYKLTDNNVNIQSNVILDCIICKKQDTRFMKRNKHLERMIEFYYSNFFKYNENNSIISSPSKVPVDRHTFCIKENETLEQNSVDDSLASNNENNCSTETCNHYNHNCFSCENATDIKNCSDIKFVKCYACVIGCTWQGPVENLTFHQQEECQFKNYGPFVQELYKQHIKIEQEMPKLKSICDEYSELWKKITLYSNTKDFMYQVVDSKGRLKSIDKHNCKNVKKIQEILIPGNEQYKLCISMKKNHTNNTIDVMLSLSDETRKHLKMYDWIRLTGILYFFYSDDNIVCDLQNNAYSEDKENFDILLNKTKRLYCIKTLCYDNFEKKIENGNEFYLYFLFFSMRNRTRNSKRANNFKITKKSHESMPIENYLYKDSKITQLNKKPFNKNIPKNSNSYLSHISKILPLENSSLIFKKDDDFNLLRDIDKIEKNNSKSVIKKQNLIKRKNSGFKLSPKKKIKIV